jgi:general stress protein 26
MKKLKQTILDIIKKPMVLANLATITEDKKPWVRYVFASANDDLTIRISTFVNSRKVKHIQNNPEVHLTCGVTDPESFGSYLQIQGRAELTTDQVEREAFWNESMLNYFSGPDDPNYGIIIVKPYRIELQEGMETKIWTNNE